MMLTSLGLLSICFVRFLFLPGALDGLTHYVTPHPDVMAHGALTMTVVVLQAFGSGWGSVITLSSFNHFKTNVMKYSWVISFGQTLVYILFGMVTFMIKSHFEGTYEKIFENVYLSISLSVFIATRPSDFTAYVESNWMLYLATASALSTMELPNMWTLIYYIMLLIASLVVMVGNSSKV